MSTRRHRTETNQLENQKSVKSIPIENQHFFHHNRKKYKLSNANLHSLHSIDTKRSSINLYQNSRIKCPQRRRQLSIPINQPRHMLTERPELCEPTSKKLSENRCMPILRGDRLSTIEDEKLQNKEKRIKNCIQLMCGVLEEIRNEKSSQKPSKSKIIDQFTQNNEKQKNKQENVESKFESYVKNITKLKQPNKIIIVKRNKSKSIINNQNIPNSNVNSKSFIIKQKPISRIELVQIPPIKKKSIQHPSKSIQHPSQTNQRKIRLQQISCSSIEKANQSSFVSQHSRQSFMKNIMDQGRTFAEDREIESKKIKFKNSKQLKQLFPIDFF